MGEWASRQPHLAAVNLDAETEKFLDHHRSRGTTFLDWQAAWRTWMARAKDFAPRGADGRSKSIQAIDGVLAGLTHDMPEVEYR